MRFIRFTANWITLWVIIPFAYLLLVFTGDYDEELSNEFYVKQFWDEYWK